MTEGRALSTMNLDSKVKCSISKNRSRLKTVKDVFASSPFSLGEMLHLNKEKCEEFIDQLYSTCQPKHLTALQALEREEDNCMKLGHHQIDSLLHGGLKCGAISEFVGPAGVGKTQWCLYYSMLAVVPKTLGGFDKDVIFIDLENTFRQERFVEILASNFPDQASKVTTYMSRIHLFRPSSLGEFTDIMNSIEEVAIENDVGLLIVDSIASLVRRQIATSSKQEIFKRGRLQMTWMVTLKKLAEQLNLCVILTNQVTTKKSSDNDKLGKDLEKEEDDDPQPSGGLRNCYQVVPALGYKWTFSVNTRIVLQYTADEHRQMIISKSPVAPYASFNYRVGKCGIQILDSGNSYSNCGVNPAYFKIKVQRKVKLT